MKKFYRFLAVILVIVLFAGSGTGLSAYAENEGTSGTGNVNQGWTVNVGENLTADSGSKINVIVNFTGSQANNERTSKKIKINISSLPENLHIANAMSENHFSVEYTDTRTNERKSFPVTYHPASGSQSAYFDADIPAGSTGQFHLEFRSDNGVTYADGEHPNNTLTITPSIDNPAENDIVVANGVQKKGSQGANPSTTLTWTSENQWDKVDKWIDTNADASHKNTSTISVNTGNKLDGSIKYEFSANNQKGVNDGKLWTKTVEITDTISLPEGWSFPDGVKLNASKNAIVTSDGTTIFSFDNLDKAGTAEQKNNTEGQVTATSAAQAEILSATLSDDKKSLTYTAEVTNPYYDASDPVNTTGELKNIDMKGTLNASAVNLPTDYYRNAKDADKITNHVTITPVTIYDVKKDSSEDSVTTIPEGKTGVPELAKSVTDKGGNTITSLKPGEPVKYTLQVKNVGEVAYPADTENDYHWVEDKLPDGLTLTQDQIETINNTTKAEDRSTGIVAEVGYNDWDTGHTTPASVRYRLTGPLAAGASAAFTFEATVKDLRTLNQNNISEINNKFTYREQDSNEVKTQIDKPSVDLTKTSDKTGHTLKDGESVNYTLRLKNSGTAAYPADTLTDTLPKGLYLSDLYSDQEGNNKINLSDGADLSETDAYIVHTSGETKTAEPVKISVSNGVTTIKWHTGEVEANGTKKLNYQAVYKAALADYTSVDKDGLVTLKNEAVLGNNPNDKKSDTVKGGDIGKVDLDKKITGKNGQEVAPTIEAEAADQDTFTYTITTKNDSETQAYTHPITVKDVIHAGLIPQDLKYGDTLVDSYDKYAECAGKYPQQSWSLNGRKLDRISWDSANSSITFTYSLNNLAANASDIFTYDVKVDVDHSWKDWNDSNYQLTNIASIPGQSKQATIIVKPVESDKKALDKDGKEVSSLPIEAGTTVTYRLKLKNNTNKSETVTGVKDRLPFGKGKEYAFSEWWKNHVEVVSAENDFLHHLSSPASGTGYTIEQEWGLENNGRPIISWSDITVPANTELVQEIKLTFPGEEKDSSDIDFGDLFREGESPNNSFIYSGGEEKTVTHTYEKSGKFYMQKGVYNIYQDENTKLDTKDVFSTKGARYVSYYIMVENTGNSADDAVKVTELRDKLPEGLTYKGLLATPDSAANGASNTVNTGDVYYGPDTAVKFSRTSGKTGDGIDIQAAANKQEITFRLGSDGKGVTLQPNHYFAFLVLAEIDNTKLKSGEDLYNTAQADIEGEKDIKTDSVTAQNTGNDSIQNNGKCDLVSRDDQKTTVESTVAIHPLEAMIPGITKKAESYRYNGDGSYKWTDFSGKHESKDNLNNAAAKVKWEITLYNDGTIPITGYTLKDTIESPFYLMDQKGELVSDGGVKPSIAIYSKASDQNSNATPAFPGGKDITSEDVKQSGVARAKTSYTIKFEGDKYRIPAGGKAVITLISDNPSTQAFDKFYNSAEFIPDADNGEIDATKIRRGEPVQSEERTYEGVKASDYVSAEGGFASTSYKTVYEKDNPGNIAYGMMEEETDRRREIEVERNSDNEKDLVRYTNYIENQSSSTFRKIVMIDVMPDVNDRGVVNQNELRDSEFTIKLPSNPNFEVKLRHTDPENGAEEKIADSNYKIEYSSLTSFTDNDFDGKEDSKRWSDKIDENTKSFRVIYTGDRGLPQNYYFIVSYDGELQDNADPGEYAWNSFGYRYNVGSYSLTAEPPKVGVTIPNRPTIRKVVVDKDGNDLGRDNTKSFEFLFKDLTDSSKDPITIQLNQGEAKELTPVTTVNGKTEGSFIEDHQYEVTESDPGDPQYKLYSIGEDHTTVPEGTTKFTFTYHRSSNIKIIGKNQYVPDKPDKPEKPEEPEKPETPDKPEKPETIDVSGEKIWDDSDNKNSKRPDSITIHLLANGVEKDSRVIKADKEGKWKYSFTNLPKYEKGEKEPIVYTVREDSVKDYTTSYKGTDITNTYEPGKRSISVTKAWADGDNQDGKRPGSVRVYLKANGNISGNPVSLDESNQWTYTWSELDRKSSDGKEIEYTVEEADTDKLPQGYTSSVSGSADKGFTITNSYTPRTTEISGEKIWDDSNNKNGKRPDSITIHLLANGVETKKQVVQADKEGKWKYSFTNLPKYEKGDPISYTVREDSVKDYTTSYQITSKGTDITNTYAPGKRSISVTKAWADGDNQDGKRPGSVRVYLKANGKTYGEPVTLAERNQWTYTWSELDRKSDGKEIEYTVEEADTDKLPQGYTSSVSGSADKGFTITNSYTPRTTEISGEKIWDDSNNKNGKRPDSITIHLLANGVETKKQVVQADKEGKWKYSFTNLPKYEKGEKDPISYTIQEDSVKDYTTRYQPTNKGINIINKYEPGKRSISVTKVWADGDNKDGKRPGSVRVYLKANGKTYGEPVTLAERNQWTYTWSELDQKSDGKEIEYTVEEADTDKLPQGYTSSVSGSADKGFTITNSYTPVITPKVITPRAAMSPTVGKNKNPRQKPVRSSTSSPNTGDTSQGTLWVVLMLASAFAVVVLKKRKQNRD